MITVEYPSWMIILLAPLVGMLFGLLLGAFTRWCFTRDVDVTLLGILATVWGGIAGVVFAGAHITNVVAHIPDLGLACILGILLFATFLVPGIWIYICQVRRD